MPGSEYFAGDSDSDEPLTFADNTTLVLSPSRFTGISPLQFSGASPSRFLALSPARHPSEHIVQDVPFGAGHSRLLVPEGTSTHQALGGVLEVADLVASL